MSEGNSRARLSVVGIVVMALFSGLFARLWFLQIGSETDTAAAETRANRVRVITEPGVRGQILDRQGRVIVKNELVDSIQVRHGMSDKERKKTIPNLGKLLGLTPKQVEERIDDPRYSPYQPVPIADNVDYGVLVYIKERPEDFPKVEAVRRSVRVHPSGTIAPHFIGYVGAINKLEQRLHEGESYAADDLIGKDGVEQVFESELRGKPRVRKIEVDSRGRFVRVLQDQPAQVGNDVQLTMDIDIQRIAQESLKQGMTQASKVRDTSIKDRFKTFGATGGTAIVLDAKDGSVIALVSAPEFDVQRFTNGLPVEEFKALNDPKNHFPLLNRAVQGLYAPGSTFKLFSSIAALEYKEITPEFSFDDRGFIRYGTCSGPASDATETASCQVFTNAGKTPYGPVNLARALTVSSDVYFYNLGLKFWKTFEGGNQKRGFGIQTTAREFGFGQPTGLGLPNEARGRLPDEQFKARLNKADPDPITRAWLPGDNMNVAVGQGDMLVTPMQLALGYAAFENGGQVLVPRMADKILTPGSESILRELPTLKAATVEIPQPVRDAIMPGLVGAVNSAEGTARRAFEGYTGIQVAGKTGTAEQPPRQDNALFVGLVNPNPPPEAKCEGADRTGCQYVVVVIVEEGGFGGSVAAPVARRIIDGLNDPATEPENVRYRAQKND